MTREIGPDQHSGKEYKDAITMSEVSRFLNPDTLESARCLRDKMALTLHDGTYFCGQDYVNDFGEMFRQISTAQLDQDDVFLCGFLRSGNHWVWEILHMILNETTDYTDRVWGLHCIDIWGDQVHDKIKSLTAPRVFGTHLRPNRLPKDILEKPVKIVYTLRNPKDVMASWFKMASILREGDRWDGDWEEFFQLQITGEFSWGSWFDHLKAFDAFFKENPQVQVHVIQFEKLLENPTEEISALCSFLGKPDSLAGQIADATSFGKMKVGIQEKKVIEDKEYTRKSGTIGMVSGKTQTWKSRFTVDQSETIDNVFDELLAGNSLADRVRAYLS